MSSLKNIDFLGISVNVAKKCIDVLLPPRCIITGRPVDRQGAIAPEAWQSLSFIGDPLCHCCGAPFGFEADTKALCGACLERRPVYNRARAALAYDDASRTMILRFKHADQIHAVHTFVPWLRRAGADLLAEADLLIPVPLHRWRLLKRRYNQAGLLAQALGKTAGIPCISDLLLRKRATKVQGHMNPSERHRNVRNAFTVHPRHAKKIAGKRIVLIDDVLTTGATVGECAKALKKAGVASVDILSIARVVKHH
jgi:ComF family protein